MPRDPISQAALEYLETTYGIPQSDVWRVTVEAGGDRYTEITIRMIIPDSLPDRIDAQNDAHQDDCSCSWCTTPPGKNAPKRHPALTAAHAVQFTCGARDGHIDGRKDSTIVPLVPTVCQRADQSGTVCGEVIRWSEANGWYHVSDRALGVATHSPMPPPVAPGMPTNAVRRTM